MKVMTDAALVQADPVKRCVRRLGFTCHSLKIMNEEGGWGWEGLRMLHSSAENMTDYCCLKFYIFTKILHMLTQRLSLHCSSVIVYFFTSMSGEMCTL